jgi:two-component system chemotaxis response regulator CheB
MMSPSLRPIRVLVVDDSALVRKNVTSLIEADPYMTVVGTACDGLEAIDACSNLLPDVVTLDISMPEMDGITCLSHLVREHQQPVIMLSTLAVENSFPTFKALALGAVDFVTKPGAGVFLPSLQDVGETLRAKIRVAASVERAKIGKAKCCPPQAKSPPSVRALHAPPKHSCHPNAPIERIIGVGASTGGACGLESLVRALPDSLPICVIAVQHLPVGFSASFARYLDSVCKLRVHEAFDGQQLQAGAVYLAQGGLHLRVQRSGDRLVLRTDSNSPPQHGYRPAIDQLFYSLATARKSSAIGVLLSGMGADGVCGLLALRRLGAETFVQDESTSVVFDMPRRAIAAGAACHVLPVDAVVGRILRACHQPKVDPSLQKCGMSL